MLRYTGFVLVGMAIIHGVASFVLFSEQLEQIYNAGLFAGLSWSMDMLAAFWFTIFTWPMIIMGLIIAGLGKHQSDFSYRRLTAVSFIVVPCLCGLVLPASGLWAFLLPGVMLLRIPDSRF
ncbi:DUF6463 family protein [Blastomonas sp.]|uniref:DUF6463 family protein n=1 Tax=Blastomonas sp. TaxID=1909299 RepID=UPI00359425E1